MASIISYTKTKIDQLLALKANLTDAVPLAGSGNLPSNNGPSAYQGSANVAARSDHIHLVQWVPGYPIPLPAWGNPTTYASPVGKSTASPVDDGKAPGTPFPVYQPYTLNTIKMSLYTAGDAGTFSLALYASSLYGLPTGAPVWTSADVTSVGTGMRTFSSLTVQLIPGMYWLFCGSKGFSSTRPRPGKCAVSPMTHMPSTNDPSWSPALYNDDFNETSGAWPTLAGDQTTMPTGGSNSDSTWWYAIQGTPA